MKRCRSAALVAVAFSVCTIHESCNGFEWTADAGRRPPIDRRSIAGIWRLTPIPAIDIPMKEFTVYPKKQIKKTTSHDIEELLLMLKDDGSFRQCEAHSNDDNDYDNEDGDLPKAELDISKSWTKFQEKELRKDELQTKQDLVSMVKGIWDYRDGKLILAADRPEKNLLKSYDEPRNRGSFSTTKDKVDIMLEGKLVASYQAPVNNDRDRSNLQVTGRNDADKISLKSSQDLSIISQSNNSATAIQTTKLASPDTHLSVPMGSIKIGKFFYPRTHPSFFDQPMFQPTKKGAFALSQIIGSLNTIPDKELIEKYKRSDFYNKTFLLTSHPIGQRKKPDPNMRWSVKFNKYVQETLPSARKKANDKDDEDETTPTTHVRVMQIKFFANNTFASIGGIGLDLILRGKFDIIGENRDHLWFQVLRFGIGRSISGSVYSEGRMLSHDDIKAYWGEISNSEDESLDPEDNNSNAKLEVQGTVLFGVGLEPTPVARFIMREYIEDEILLGEDDDEEEEDDDDNNSLDSDSIESSGITLVQNDGIDWDEEGGQFFQ